MFRVTPLIACCVVAAGQAPISSLSVLGGADAPKVVSEADKALAIKDAELAATRRRLGEVERELAEVKRKNTEAEERIASLTANLKIAAKPKPRTKLNRAVFWLPDFQVYAIGESEDNINWTITDPAGMTRAVRVN